MGVFVGKNGKALSHYMSLPYKIEVRPIAQSDGGGYSATLPELGSDAFIAQGETIEEAIGSLTDLQELLIKELLEEGQHINEPEERIDYSGKVVLRMPPALHKKCAEYANSNTLSMNSAIVITLEKSLYGITLLDELEGRIIDCLEPMKSIVQNVLEMQYRMAGNREQQIELDTTKLAIAG